MSEKGNAIKQARYRKTEKGKTAHARDAVRHRKTEKGRATNTSGNARYRKTEKGRATRARAKARRIATGKAAADLARRRATKLQATPVWGDPAAIARVYEEAQDLTELTYRQWEVDHIVPLKHKRVSGLHVEFNLRAIEAIENNRKGNRHWPDMPELTGRLA